MKLSNTTVRSRSNISDEGHIPMAFAKNSEEKLASLFIDLYSDPVSAIIREYSANALDSHMKVGQTRPVEITLPSFADPVFKVKDYGIGMSLEDVKTIYSQYGASTKDQDNDSIGSYGLGCKSALSLNPAFTVTAVKDNKKTVAIISREEKSLGKMRIVAELDTMEPNGVEVSIPAHQGTGVYAVKAAQVFFTWPENSVIIDGKEPSNTMHDKERFLKMQSGSHIEVVKTENSRYSGIIVNMGGIGYYTDAQKTTELFSKVSEGLGYDVKPSHYSAWVISVPLGSVDLIPNRENLRWSSKTTNFVTSVLLDDVKELIQKADDIIDSIPTRSALLSSDFFNQFSGFQSIFKKPFKWRGEKLPKEIGFKAGTMKKATVDENLHYVSTNGKVEISKWYYSSLQTLSFGLDFNDQQRSYQIKGKADNSIARGSAGRWLFVDGEGKYPEIQENTVARSINKYLSSLPERERNVNIVYIKDNLLEKNVWLKTLIEDSVFSVSKITFEEMEVKSEAHRLEKARLARTRLKNTSVAYWVLDVAAKGEPWSWSKMTTDDIDAHLEENKKAVLYADDILFNTKNYDAYVYLVPFLPKNTMIVRMDGGKTLDGFLKRISSEARLDILDVIQKEIDKKTSGFDLVDYFTSVHLGGNYSKYVKALNLPDGFLKDVLTPRAKNSIGREYDLGRNLRWISSSYPAVQFSDSSAAYKSKKILDTLPLLFEIDTPWKIEEKSDAYKKGLESYILQHTDTIESIVNS